MRMRVVKWAVRAYAGYARLWQVFWGGGVAMLMPLAIAIGSAKERGATAPDSWAPFVTHQMMDFAKKARFS